ncbi:hypothetical protein [Tunturiibacter gelidiferens]|uniref:hypothetical protein n=1 Tax=Tunturiibacter gelidiferens TaxID=3069689 RepID=UPI003D9BD511
MELFLLSVVLLARVAVALSVGVGVLHDEQVLRDLWLLPLRDFLGWASGRGASLAIRWCGAESCSRCGMDGLPRCLLSVFEWRAVFLCLDCTMVIP